MYNKNNAMHIHKYNLYNYTTLKTNARKTRSGITVVHNYITIAESIAAKW